MIPPVTGSAGGRRLETITAAVEVQHQGLSGSQDQRPRDSEEVAEHAVVASFSHQSSFETAYRFEITRPSTAP
jgi:hypothetical protein